MSKMVSLRVDEDLLDWATAYAQERGVSRSALLEGALVSFREDCKAGVPELREKARKQAGVESDCAGGVHDWPPEREDEQRRCRGCGVKAHEHFVRATHERAEFFSGLRCPDSITGKVAAKKAYAGGS